MTFFSILFALIAEQYRPVTASHWIRRISIRWLDWVAGEFGGKTEAGASPIGARLACLVALILPTFFVFGVYVTCMLTYPILAFLWNVLIAYLFFGFRQFSHSFTLVHEAIKCHDLPGARVALMEWYGPELDATNLSETDVISLALERAILDSHHHVFGVLFWFLMPMGPAGMVLYRLAFTAAQRWSEKGDFNLSEAARHFFYVLDWIPARITAIGFAVVGNFEGAVYSWRHLTSKWSDTLSAVILASGSGALGVRLGEPLSAPDSNQALLMAEAGEPVIYEVGSEPNERAMRSAVGLVWRLVIVWMALLLMTTTALWLG
ncbi:adenosylcobinamide-phosphate synthase [Polynucleobacter meluiroseus]|uniref:Cobalamin biosynthesis protein CobD n=1 Tax=Polynucleobacter meluiroseus TaxID=1938814 RepID=A0A240DZ04_9BURK|nr:CobD/CbiB family protein [Polynucleobacter meluiroseus]SNX28172.1 adenosylcobinamide-phosphate synthase [Polynucleobacter meluiroseus]